MQDPLFTGSNVEYLLGRLLRKPAVDGGLRALAGARVLVTGAAGSVGSATIARLTQLGVERIVALDHHEGSLFRLGRDLAGAAPLELRIADVRNEAKLGRIFDEVRPDVVLHFAAYKHVPFAEYGPDEFVAVNVLGTQAVANASAAAGARHLVYTSSDKAVNPPSAYGATKRLAETLLLAHAAAGGGPLAVHVVRYVNILGSNGSVSETLAQQARARVPLTLTDERMDRYWMAMDEAVDLLVHSLGLPSGSRTVLDTGDPLLVKTMAQRIHHLAWGAEVAPAFEIIGSRPGERLFEELASASESLGACGEDPVWQILQEGAREGDCQIADALNELRDLLAEGQLPRLHGRLMELGREFQ